MKLYSRAALTGLAATGALAIGALAPAQAAAPGIQVKPWTFVGTVANCGSVGTDQVASAWQAHQGEADAGASDHALYLQKIGLTSDCSSAGATVTGVSGSTFQTAGFDVRNDGHCGAGAPRFDVMTTDGVDHFLGCTYGTYTDLATGGLRSGSRGPTPSPRSRPTKPYSR